MNVTRDVILDLLPLYVAKEASADTRALVEQYLASDPETADMARELARMETARDVPAPVKKEAAMEAYLEAKKIMFLRTVVYAVVGAGLILALAAFTALLVFRFVG